MRYVSLGLFILALMLMQVLIGGAGLVFSLPPSIVLAAAGVLLIFAPREQIRNSMTVAAVLSALALGGYVIARSQFSPVVYLARWDLFLTLGALSAYLVAGCCLVRARDRLTVVSFLLALAVAHVLIGGVQFKQADEFISGRWCR